MTDVDQVIIAPLESALLALPGGQYPAMRAGYGAAAGLAVAFGVKPDLMFDGEQPRAWIITSPDDPGATWFPWPAAVIVPALVLGVFI
ncbi:MAG: hypothetical protein ACPGR8_06325 [Limisphaerales bacterium]